MTTRADTIARLLNQAGEYLKAAACPGNPQVYATSGPALSIDAAMRCINDAFLETLGSAAVAGEAAGPWVVRVVDTLGHASWDPGVTDLTRALRFDRGTSDEVAKSWQSLHRTATVLPLAEAERMEAAATLGGLPAHTRKVLAELADEEPSAEVLAADDSPDEPADSCARCGQERAHLLHAPISPGALCHGVGPLRDVYAHPFVAATPTPEPPKPAGWVVRHQPRPALAGTPTPYYGRAGWHASPSEAGPFASRADAILTRGVRLSETAQAEADIVPVDAAGNVIEADVIEAEDIGATLRREECERKAARQSGVAWEAARAGEEAERLRGELAAVKAERDRLAEAEEALSYEARTQRERADALAAEVQRSREQKPVHLALVNKQGAVVDGYLIKTRALAEDDARRRACTVAPLYLAPVAPVVRDHSGVIAQCEDALREWDRKGPHCSATSSLVAVTLTKARNALQGAS